MLGKPPPTNTAFWLDRHWWCHYFMRYTLVMSSLYAFWSWNVSTNFPAVLAKNKARQVRSFTKPSAGGWNDPESCQPPAPFRAYGSFRNCTRQNQGTAGNHEVGGFVNSAVRRCRCQCSGLGGGPRWRWFRGLGDLRGWWGLGWFKWLMRVKVWWGLAQWGRGVVGVQGWLVSSNDNRGGVSLTITLRAQACLFIAGTRAGYRWMSSN